MFCYQAPYKYDSETVVRVILLFEIEIVTTKVVYSKFENMLSSASFEVERP